MLQTPRVFALAALFLMGSPTDGKPAEALATATVEAPASEPTDTEPVHREPIRIRDLIGERLRFKVRWGPIPAGEAVLAVEAGDGQKIQLVATAKTLPAIDPLYRVRDRMVSTVRPDLRSFTYEKNSEEGKKRRRERIKFDLRVGKARYRRDDRQRTEIDVPKNVLDPLSCLYAFRLAPEGESEIELPVSDGKKMILGSVAVIGREKIKTPAGTFQTLIVQPKLEGIGGIFKKSPNASITIWLTDDPFKRPVKMASAVAVGQFVAELVELETDANTSTAAP